MKKCLFTGVATALATPFTEKGINLPEFKKFINFQIDSGINALVVCGTTGEACTMMQEEKIAVILSEITKIKQQSSDKEVAKILEHIKSELNCLV